MHKINFSANKTYGTLFATIFYLVPLLFLALSLTSAYINH